tara:strand:- start:1160 stop:2257 length:1098 start_codon:yes stop_codon:yes gene_type:complete
MIITISSGLGLKQAIQNNLINLESHIQITGIYGTSENKPIYLTKDILENIQKNNKITSVHSIIHKSAIISNKDNIDGVILKGIDPTYKYQFIKTSILEGDYFDNNNTNQLLISLDQAKIFNLKVNDSCILYFLSENNNIQKRKFIIRGIFHMNNNMFDQVYAFTQKETLAKINKWDKNQVTSYEIMLNNNSSVDNTVAQINQILPYNLFSKSIENRFPGIFNWTRLFDKNISFILIIMAIICVINMTNALLILVIERFKMIGILKSYGSSNYSILKIFLYNSWRISLTGIILGNIIGASLCLIQQKSQIIELDSASYFVNYLPIFLDIKLLLIINIITFAITQLSIVIPYYIMKKLSPANILKIN